MNLRQQFVAATAIIFLACACALRIRENGSKKADFVLLPPPVHCPKCGSELPQDTEPLQLNKQGDE